MKTGKILKYDKQLQDEINNNLKIQLEKEGIKNKKMLLPAFRNKDNIVKDKSTSIFQKNELHLVA
jgi:hypothetical protein